MFKWIFNRSRSSSRKTSRRKPTRRLGIERLEDRRMLAADLALLRTIDDPAPGVTSHGFGHKVAMDGNNVLVAQQSAGGNGEGLRLFDAATGSLVRSFNNPGGGGGDVMATSGNFVLIGNSSYGEHSPPEVDLRQSGQAYLIDATTKNILHTFQNPTPGKLDLFGQSVAISGNLVLIGAFGDDTDGFDVGMAYLFDATTGNLLHTFHDPTPTPGATPSDISDGFGQSVAISGNNVLIGAYRDSTLGIGYGQAHLFDAVTGNLVHTFSNPVAAHTLFSTAVSISGNNILIGAPLADPQGDQGEDVGQAYLYDAKTGNLVHTFDDPTPTPSITEFDTGDQFGHAVAVSGNNVLIGAPHDRSHGSVVGQAHLFNATSGNLLHTFDNPVVQDASFGVSVAASGNKLLIGAPSAKNAEGVVTGRAYLYGYAEIRGFKWQDQNGDGAWDSGEPGVNGWKVQLVQNGEVIREAITGDDPGTSAVEVGAYWFNGLDAGNYTVREVSQEGWQQTFPGESGEHEFVLETSEIIAGTFGVAESPNFGNQVLPPTLTGTTLEVTGTTLADTITVSVGTNVVVTFRGATFTYAAANVTTINVHGLGGNDKLTFTGKSGNETVTLRPGLLDVTGSLYTLHADGFETQYVYSGDGADDRASLYDSAGNDTFAARPTYAYMSGNNFYNYVGDFDRVSAYATAGGAADQAYLYDSIGNDTFAARPTYAYLSGTGFYNYAESFDKVYAYATAGGAADQAYLYDSAGNDTFTAKPTLATLSGTGFYNYVGSFDKVYAYATAGDAGGAGDQAYLYDSAGNDTLSAKPTLATLSGTGFYNYAGSFDKVYAYATAGDAGGAGDQANLYDSAGNDTLNAKPTLATLSGTGFYNYAGSFDKVYAYATAGGTADLAYLYDSAGNDTFTARPTFATLSGTGFYNYASTFDKVYAYATAGDAGGTGDQAHLYDSAGNDTFAARPTYAYLTGTGFYNYASAFDRVYAYATAGGTGDEAHLYDSAGNDTFAARPTYAYLSGAGYYNYASNFDRVNAYATAGNAGGTGDQAYLYDSAGADTYYGRSNYGRLTGTGFYNYVAGFQRVSALATAGGTDTRDVRVVDYVFAQSGTWENVL
ncbi:MAG: hypothetical protein K8T91_27430 [Planctomycetes bacterium]|nr:hypothetical protein [Planctomycetota bacterium]